MACCKSSEIILHEAPGFSNTRSHCIPDRMERGSGKKMAVGGRIKRGYWGKARRIKGKVLCREELFHQYLWQVPKQFKAGIRPTKCRVHWNNISPRGFVWSWKRSFFLPPSFSWLLRFHFICEDGCCGFLGQMWHSIRFISGGPTGEEERVCVCVVKKKVFF